jgi:hypothetical protein
MDWKPISSAPFDRDLELAVIGGDGLHALVFPCRRILGGWMKVGSKERIDVRPTHWRKWREKSLSATVLPLTPSGRNASLASSSAKS